MSDKQFLILKRGLYYRPNSQGYTTNVVEAGLYSFEDAWDITHPNGGDGPRDGMDFVQYKPVPHYGHLNQEGNNS